MKLNRYATENHLVAYHYILILTGFSMPRLPRASPIDMAVHMIQRGNHRRACFGAEENFGTYLSSLKEYAVKYHVDIQ